MSEAGISSVMGVYSSLSQAVTWSSVLVYGIIFGLSYGFYKVILRPYLTPLRKIPGRPIGNIFLGNLREIFGGESIDVYVKWVKEMKTGMIRYNHILGQQRLLVAEADAMKHIMVTHSKNYVKPTFLFRLFTRVTGDGLISLNGEQHLTQRKLCLGAFKSSFLKNMIPAIQKHGEELVDFWAQKLTENEDTDLDVGDDMSRMTMDIISECGFGYNTEALHKPEQKGCRAFTDLLYGFKPNIMRVFFPWLNSHLPSEENRKFARNLSVTNKMIHDVISNKQKALEECTDESKLSDLLSMLLLARDTESGEGLSRQQLRDHVMTFMLSGHETTATSMTWCLLKLSQCAEIQKRLCDEVTAILPPKGQPITIEHLEKMPYLACVVKETLRLYPAAPMTFRTAVNDDVLNGYFIPAGTIINIQVGALHRNPAYWTDPEEFKPERFMDDSKVHPYSWLPFVAGPRMCIGYKFALMEMKVILAILFREFDHKLSNPDQIYKKRQRITMRPDPAPKLKAKVLN
ncbi:cytochrome P450 monooxygenase 169-like [Haliotis rubra]|uniref:cytochrome P450 monooxygenase 169-like n=1 Tax=Haliotis rubra TaxID=36100 RepID=UPI001EE5AFA7|nr:cytochrome P450 monooxygenase 169-like [Haliotis rubra]